MTEEKWHVSIFRGTDSALLIHLFLTISLAGFVFLLAVSPFMMLSENVFVAGMAAATYKIIAEANICHQLPERTFSLGGILMPVCVRDFAIFFGGLLGLVASFFSLPRFLSSKWILLAATLPIAADGVTQTILRMRESDDRLRFATGILCGAVFAHFLGRKILEERGSSQLKRNVKVAGAIVLLLLLLFSLLSFGVGFFFKTRAFAFEVAEENSSIKNPTYMRAFYLPPRSAFTIPLDPFLKNYNDILLKDMCELHLKPTFGMWVVVILEEKPRYEGKYVFLSGGKGEYFYIDALTGKVLEKNIHT